MPGLDDGLIADHWVINSIKFKNARTVPLSGHLVATDNALSLLSGCCCCCCWPRGLSEVSRFNVDHLLGSGPLCYNKFLGHIIIRSGCSSTGTASAAADPGDGNWTRRFSQARSLLIGLCCLLPLTGCVQRTTRARGSKTRASRFQSVVGRWLKMSSAH